MSAMGEDGMKQCARLDVYKRQVDHTKEYIKEQE